jgi:hypothetical protein
MVVAEDLYLTAFHMSMCETVLLHKYISYFRQTNWRKNGDLEIRYSHLTKNVIILVFKEKRNFF